MAVACVTAVGAALGAMYFMGRDTKVKEGNESPYRSTKIIGAGPSDLKMTSTDVAAVVSVPKPGEERIPKSK